jgi:hypothetical protein
MTFASAGQFVVALARFAWVLLVDGESPDRASEAGPGASRDGASVGDGDRTFAATAGPSHFTFCLISALKG